jgi:membrane protease YdiL (CAAX protease family)
VAAVNDAWPTTASRSGGGDRVAVPARAALRRAADLLPLAALTLGAAVQAPRPLVLAALVAGLVFSLAADRRRTAAWAAAIPVAVTLVWGLLALPAAASDGSTCEAVDAPFATFRLAEAVLALGSLAALMRVVGGDGGELGLRRPTRRVGIASLAALVCLGPLGLAVGPALAGPFFGPVVISAAAGSVVPAITFAFSNGVMEEVVYRGSLRAWTSRVTGRQTALVGQAVVFGLAHAGPGYIGSPVPTMAAMFAAALIAGLIVERTGSLAFPIAAHVGLDIPLYYGNACRIA